MTDLFETITKADESVITAKTIRRAREIADENQRQALKPPVFLMPGDTLPATPFAHIPRARAHLPTSNVLALDLGTHCGWAVAKRDGRTDYGTESFHRVTGGAKWAEFRRWLSEGIKQMQIEVLYFEDVKAHGPGQILAAHAYGGFLAMAQMVCHQHNVRMVGVGVGTVKKAWTGKGNAKKAEMIAAARAKGFRVGTDEDDTADALAILSLAVKREA